HVDLSGLQDSKLALLGGVAALRASMALVAAQARADQGGTAWPDYARFECYSCHHDLKSPGYQQWRQVRGYGRRLDGRVIPGQAGRPQLRLWPAPLTWLALTQAGGDRDGLTAALRGLQEAIDAQVFGAPSDVEREARNLAAWADRFLARNDVETIGQDDLLGLLRALATLPPAAYPDYDSARQIAWAIDVIDSERDPKPAGARGAAIRPILNRLRQQLKLDPFEARDDWARASRDLDPGEIPAAHQRFSDNELVRALISAAEYDPTLFRSNLGRLLQALPDR
ncbi:MAG TPA: hypothetical protein VF590_00200, partial [Isosphaeraceae bacterium]